MVATRRVAWLGWATLIGAASLLLAESCAGPRTVGLAPEPAPAGPVPPGRELWVDAHAPEGGDGTAARPLRRLTDALDVPAPARRVHLLPGLYPGPFVAPDGTELVGGSAAVLTAEGGATVLEARGSVSLRRLLVQGGAVGIDVTGNVSLEDVRLSGQRLVGVAVGPGAAFQARGTVLEASVTEAVGLLLGPGTRSALSGLTFEGPWRRGIEARAPERLLVERTRFRGSLTALHQRDGSVELSDIAISEGRGPGLYVVGGELRLRRVQVQGQEYALLTGTGASVEAEDLTSSRADRAGVGVVNARARFTRLVITEAGTFGGLQGVTSEVTVQGLAVSDIAGHGVSMRGGSLTVDGGTVRRTHDPEGAGGDGLQLRGGRAVLQGLTVEDTAGSCLVAAEAVEATVVQSTLVRCRTAGLVVETAAHLSASEVSVRTTGGPAAVATGDARLVLRGFSATSAAEGLLWAECSAGARVTASDVRGTLPVLPCVEVLRAPPGAP